VTGPSKIGRYDIIERVGRGGMAAVYRGRDTVLDREVAIKIMSADFAADDTSRPRFYREARAAAKLQHRNIVTIFEFGEEDDTPFIVMEFLRGQDLSRRMRTEPVLGLGEKLEIIAELCDGLQFAHDQGVVHRDVKPANIWLVPDGSVKLLDFGIAKSASSTRTGQGAVFGSISYMSPEHVSGRDVDGRADVFSAGVVLYELLSGKKPFAGDSPTAVLARILDAEPASAVDLPADLPRALVAAVMKALEKDRVKRYGQAADFAADLRAVRSGSGSVVAAAPVAAPAAGVPAAHVDLADAVLADSGAGAGLDAGHRELAGSVTVVKTPDLGGPTPRASRGRARWLLAAACVLIAAAAGGYVWVDRGGVAHSAARAAPPPPSPPPAPPARVGVQIASDPEGAAIAVDGVPTGLVTPSEIQVDPSDLPSVRLTRGDLAPIEGRLTPDDVRAGRWARRFEAPAPPPEIRTRVALSGDYPFEVVDERGRIVSAAADAHDIWVTGRRTLRMRNGEFLLDRPVAVDGSGKPVTLAAPGLATVDVRGPEDCTAGIDGRDLGNPPVFGFRVAAGSYTAALSCPDGRRPRVPFTVGAGERRVVVVK
jgi:eukaryotic-like serine/threonine-protein kinase